jgi:hypothetical protein
MIAFHGVFELGAVSGVGRGLIPKGLYISVSPLFFFFVVWN